jgi:hypothetical protein
VTENIFYDFIFEGGVKMQETGVNNFKVFTPVHIQLHLIISRFTGLFNVELLGYHLHGHTPSEKQKLSQRDKNGNSN